MNRFVFVAFCSFTAALAAQQPAVPAFEVASIKPQTDSRPPRGVSSPDRFNNPNAVDAKAAGIPSRAEMRLLVRTLLGQRFNLRAHGKVNGYRFRVKLRSVAYSAAWCTYSRICVTAKIR